MNTPARRNMGQIGPTPLGQIRVTESLVLVTLFRRLSSSPAPWFSLPLTLATIPIAIICPSLGFLISRVVTVGLQLQDRGYPVPSIEGAPAAALEMVDSLMAGPTEELALTLLVVVALRTVAMPWWLVVVAAVVVRVPFHLYYGWGYVALAIWPVLIVLLYKLTGQIIGIIVAHALFNATSYLPVDAMDEARDMLSTLGVLAALLLLIIGAYRHRDARDTRATTT